MRPLKQLRILKKQKLILKKTLKEEYFIDGRQLIYLNYQEKSNHIVESVIDKLNISERDINSYQPSQGRGKIINAMGGSIIDQTY